MFYYFTSGVALLLVIAGLGILYYEEKLILFKVAKRPDKLSNKLALTVQRFLMITLAITIFLRYTILVNPATLFGLIYFLICNACSIALIVQAIRLNTTDEDFKKHIIESNGGRDLTYGDASFYFDTDYEYENPSTKREARERWLRLSDALSSEYERARTVSKLWVAT
eukprot:TRINITY_DN9661_c0_g1_i1.p1 TRINITY_DN9661_c0_g1~~TRINITY_DN9661_c0_g1_i1.p1  ORF type:complete len:168 (-),score=21.88 TRINITY_DN9661_c0_g1_i1:137-640(-)